MDLNEAIKKIEKALDFYILIAIICLTEPDTPLFDADQVGSFFIQEKNMSPKQLQVPMSVDEQIDNLWHSKETPPSVQA